MTEARGVSLSRVGVLMLGVTDSGRSLGFYRDQLGLPLRGTGGEFAFLDAGALTLALRETKDLGPPTDERRVEVVFSVDDIDAAHEALSARGVEFRREPRVVTGDQHAADFRDPDGHVLSILGRALGAEPRSRACIETGCRSGLPFGGVRGCQTPPKARLRRPHSPRMKPPSTAMAWPVT